MRLRRPRVDVREERSVSNDADGRIEYPEPGGRGDPEVLERLRAGAVAVSIEEGAARTIDLRLSR